MIVLYFISIYISTNYSKRTLKKFSLAFRVLGTVQNIFLKPTTFMANNYFEICTSDKFKGVTGKMISDHGVILKVAPQKMDGLNSFKQVVIKSTYYPCYADNKIIQDKLWHLCEQGLEMISSMKLG